METGTHKLKWFVVHTYSGHENKAKLALHERVKQHNLDASFGQILIPTESVLEVKGGQRRTTTRNLRPTSYKLKGYWVSKVAVS